MCTQLSKVRQTKELIIETLSKEGSNHGLIPLCGTLQITLVYQEELCHKIRSQTSNILSCATQVHSTQSEHIHSKTKLWDY